MSRPDLSYLASLVAPIRSGDANAFAELFAATYQKQYRFACDFLRNSSEAISVLEDTYTEALRSVPRLRDDELVVAYLTQLNFSACLKRRVDRDIDPFAERISIEDRNYSIRRIMELPYSESQSILLTAYCKMKLRDVASLLELNPQAVRHYISNGRQRLKIGGGTV